MEPAGPTGVHAFRAVPRVGRAVPLVLASQSPRRRALLEQIGFSVEVVDIDVVERAEEGETASAYQARIVDAKLDAALDRAGVKGRVVLVADTEVVLDGRVLGKPADDAHGRDLIASLSGRAHDVVTRFALGVRGDGGEGRASESVTTRVHVRALDESAIARYVATGEGRDKAGGYAVQGRFSFAIERLEGSYANVVGLPVANVVLMLEQLGSIDAFPFDIRFLDGSLRDP